jgi:hypothetical protein
MVNLIKDGKKIHNICPAYKMMVFTKKFPQSGETTHIRVPKVYADLILELMVTFDKRFDVEKGKHLLKKFIHNLT